MCVCVCVCIGILYMDMCYQAHHNLTSHSISTIHAPDVSEHPATLQCLMRPRNEYILWIDLSVNNRSASTAKRTCHCIKKERSLVNHLCRPNLRWICRWSFKITVKIKTSYDYRFRLWFQFRNGLSLTKGQHSFRWLLGVEYATSEHPHRWQHCSPRNVCYHLADNMA